MPVPEDIVAHVHAEDVPPVQNSDLVFALNELQEKFAELHRVIAHMVFTRRAEPGEEFNSALDRQFVVSADGRCKSLALTRLEEAEMWALRAVTS